MSKFLLSFICVCLLEFVVVVVFGGIVSGSRRVFFVVLVLDVVLFLVYVCFAWVFMIWKSVDPTMAPILCMWNSLN